MKNQLLVPGYLGRACTLMVAMFLLSALACSKKPEVKQDLHDPGCRKVGVLTDTVLQATFDTQVSSFNNRFRLYFPGQPPVIRDGFTPHLLSFDKAREPHKTYRALIDLDTVTLTIGFGKPFADSNLIALYLVLVKDSSYSIPNNLCQAHFIYAPDTIQNQSRMYFTYDLGVQEWQRADSNTVSRWITNFENTEPSQQVRGYTLDYIFTDVATDAGPYLYPGLKEGGILTLFGKKNQSDTTSKGTLNGGIISSEQYPPQTISHTVVKPCPPNCPR